MSISRIKIIGVIPARIGSTRLPEKVLAPIAGKPMVQRVWEQVSRAAELDQVIVACDDARIVKCIESAGGRAEMTSRDHANGSSRVAEIARRFPADVLINIQGDEPVIRPESIDQLAQLFREEASVQAATLAVRRSGEEEYLNPNVVKVVCDGKGNALYFSRSPLPHYRDPGSSPKSFLKHLGIYGYQKEFLLNYVSWPAGTLENLEKLEQLRILENGHSIRVIETAYDSWSVDTAEDLARVESKIVGVAGR